VIYVLANSPVTLDTPIVLNGPIPRAMTEPRLLELQGQLLVRLQRAQELTL
jgi:hypothetical protein